MTYKVIHNSNGNYQVIEISSGNVMFEHPVHETAYKKYRSLKTSHTGFEGWTPKFIISSKK